MKSINDFITESQQVNEAQETQYTVSFLDPKGDDDLPFSVKIIVPMKHKKAFDDFLNKQEGNIFAHADGEDIEY